MNIRDLEAFVAVVESGSIVGASAKLNLTQPGVTRRVQNLENALGIALLDRLSKPLKPTYAGREAYEEGRRALLALANLKAAVAPDGNVSGEFRLGIMPYLSETALAAPLDKLREEFPDLTLRIVSGWSTKLMEQVQRSELDAAALCLADGFDPPEGLASDDLGTQPVLLVAARSLNVPKSATLADLAKFPWVMNENGCGFRAFLRHRFEAARLPFHVGVEAISADLRLSLVARGLGVGILTSAAFARSDRRDDLELVDSPEFRPQVRAWMLHRPPACRLARPIETFRNGLLEALKSPAAFSS